MSDDHRHDITHLIWMFDNNLTCWSRVFILSLTCTFGVFIWKKVIWNKLRNPFSRTAVPITTFGCVRVTFKWDVYSWIKAYCSLHARLHIYPVYNLSTNIYSNEKHPKAIKGCNEINADSRLEVNYKLIWGHDTDHHNAYSDCLEPVDNNINKLSG